jgi:hypothetical protein
MSAQTPATRIGRRTSPNIHVVSEMRRFGNEALSMDDSSFRVSVERLGFPQPWIGGTHPELERILMGRRLV